MLKQRYIILLAIMLLLTLGLGSIVVAASEGAHEAAHVVQQAAGIKLIIGNKTAMIDEKEVEMDVAPFIENGRTMVPFRFISEELGAEIEWDPVERKVSYVLNDMVVELWIDNNMASVDGVKKLVDDNDPVVVPKVLDGRTFVPIRFIVEALGFDVKWNPDIKEVSVAPAQDYNSSRSNKPRPIIAVDNNDPNRKILIVGNWELEERKATYQLDEDIIEIYVDKGMILLNGEEVKLSEKGPTILVNRKNNPILGPINFRSEVLKWVIEWDPDRQELAIRFK